MCVKSSEIDCSPKASYGSTPMSSSSISKDPELSVYVDRCSKAAYLNSKPADLKKAYGYYQPQLSTSPTPREWKYHILFGWTVLRSHQICRRTISDRNCSKRTLPDPKISTTTCFRWTSVTCTIYSFQHIRFGQSPDPSYTDLLSTDTLVNTAIISRPSFCQSSYLTLFEFEAYPLL